MLIIENDFLKIELNKHGACLKSIFDKRKNKELLYQPDGRSWSGQDVVIFPVIAALKNHRYKVDGKSYSLKNHGLIRYNDVYLVNQTEEEITLGFDDNEETLILYPFKFHFEVTYKLENDKISIKYHVINKNDKTMYFSVGGHPALGVNLINGEFENVAIEVDGVFHKQYLLNEEGSQIVGERNINISGYKKLSKEEITAYHTLIYDARNVKSIKLNINDNCFIFDVLNAPVVAMWSMEETGNFICVEPWWGLPDYDIPEEEISKKKEIIELDPQKEFETGYSITVLK